MIPVPLSGAVIQNNGRGFTSVPTLGFADGGGGSGATATATLLPAPIYSIGTTSGGSGYTILPTATVTSSDGNGGGATVAAHLNPRPIASVTVINGGHGYTTAPTAYVNGNGAILTAVISGGTVISVTVNTPGSYTGAPAITFNGGGGTSATATCAMGPTSVYFTMTSGGSGYTAAPHHRG